MEGIVKQLTTTVGEMISLAQASISPFKIHQVEFASYKTSQVVQHNECMYLFKKSGLSECVVVGAGPAKKNYSLFRQTTEIEARLNFETLCKTMVLLVRCCPQLLTEDILQKLSCCCREQPTWSAAHVAAYVGLYSALEQKDLQGLINSACQLTHMTPLMVSVLGKQPECLEALLRQGASISLVDKKGNTVYHLALKYCPLVITVLKEYDEAGMINWPNSKGQTPLYLACERKIPEAVEVLVQAGADPNHSNTSTLPIHAAVINGDIRSVGAIIQKYTDQKDARDAMDHTPLHYACTEEMVSKLAMLGCNLNLKNADGETPLMLMMREKRRGCIRSMLYHGASCNVQDSQGETVLHKAVREDDRELVRTYSVFSADPNIRNANNHSPLHLAAVSTLKDREQIMFLLNISGSRRCTKEVKGCFAGCVAECSDKATFYEMLSMNGSGSVLDMVDIPCNLGDRVLCLDGGGIRGLVMIQILIEIENAVGKPIKECFDWIGGTSTGGILALGIGRGFSLTYIRSLYLRMKDEIFRGNRPYSSAVFESMLKREFGETTVMADIKTPKVMVTATLADRYPAALHIFRNYEQPSKEPHSESGDSELFPARTPADKQLIWEAARSTGAAPTYFRAFGHFLDGGLISNNPTLDILTEIHEYSVRLQLIGQKEKVKPLRCVVSLGTGRIPESEVKNVDIFRPEGIMDACRAVSGVLSLSRLLIDQASASEGRVVDRARAWCSMINVPYFRFSPQLSEDVALDCQDHATLINMMWETQYYIMAHRRRIHELANLIRASF